MKVNPRIKVLTAKYTNRINLLLCVSFFITLGSCYVEYLDKKRIDPTFPWIGMFLTTPMQPSWEFAAPFITVNK